MFGDEGLLGDGSEEGFGEVGLVVVGFPLLAQVVVLVGGDTGREMAHLLDGLAPAPDLAGLPHVG